MQNMKQEIKGLKEKLRTKDAAMMVLRQDFNRQKIQVTLIQDFDIAGMYQQNAIDAQERLKRYEETKINPDILIDLQSQLDDAVAEQNIKENENAQLTQQLQYKRKECETLVLQIHACKDELQQAKLKAKEACRKLVARDRELVSVRTMLQKANETIENHKNHLPDILANSQDQEEKVKCLESQLEHITAEMNTMKYRNSQLEVQIVDTKTRNSELETELKNAKLVLDVLQNERNSLQMECQDTPAEITSLRNELITVRMRLEEKICDNERMHTALDLRESGTPLDTPRLNVDPDLMKEYQKQRLEWNKTHDGLVKQIDELKCKLAALRLEQEEYMATTTDLVTSNKQMKEKVIDSEMHIKRLKDKIQQQHEVEMESRAAVGKFTEMTNTIDMLRYDVETKTREMEEKKLTLTLPPIVRTFQYSEPAFTEMQDKLDKEIDLHTKTKQQLRKVETSHRDTAERLEWREKSMKHMEAEYKQQTLRKEITIRELRNSTTTVDSKTDMTNFELKKLRRENEKLKSRINHLEDCQILRIG